MDASLKLKSLIEIKEIVENLRKEGKTIVTTNGCFDILHAGHISTFEKAKSFGDILIVGLNSDSSVRKYKPSRPINSQFDRAKVLSTLSLIDYIVIFNEDDPRNLLDIIKPNFHVKSKAGFIGIEKETVERNNGKVVLVDDLPGFSTTSIINKINQAKK